MKQIDLHVHSNSSDGTLSPEEVVLLAKSKGLSAIALTDHDTVSGVETAIKKGKEIGLTVVPGIEFSADYNGKEVHMLGYYMDYKNPKLLEKLNYLVESRTKRNLQIIDKLATLGMPLTFEDLGEGYGPDTVLTRAHFAAALLKKGYIKTRDQAFNKYIGAGKPAYVARERFTTHECMDMIHNAGGLAVLAHPKLYDFSNSEVTQVIKDLASKGLDGVECIYATHTQNETAHLLQVCKNLDLLSTGGSDFHGDNKPNLELGSGYGHLQVPYDLLEGLQNKLKR
ncbi:PHP domain-containing protein [Cellulosilyticum ruminicola]|uniref:PHP domain-containing protein n=1 Tax=Cellulosilyticum ruminicola TaxID=425254 RepID=UPI0006CFB8CE|nr:PHP domain-containing protein [Cellulosilyticum ruminicola]